MSEYHNGAAEDRERRRRELQRMQEKRTDSMARELMSKRLVTDDIEKLDKPVSQAEYQRDCQSDLRRELARSESNRR